MKYTKHIGYGVLLGASVMMAASMTVKADENEQEPIPVEEQSNLEPETVPEETLAIEEEPVIEEIESINESVLSAEKTAINNGIPVLYLNIDESKGTIDDMDSDFEHKTYCYGTLDFVLPSSDFKYADLDSDLKEYYGLDMQIKGRGNSTWGADKKPYKIKLDKKTDLLGLGSDEKNKHWVLLANMYDATLIRDRLTGYIGDEIGLDYTPIGVPVDVVMNDKYLGSYLLMEHVRVGTGRIDIDELTEDDVNMPDITGGYVVQNGNQENPSNPNYFRTNSGEAWYNHTPSFDLDDDGYENEAQKNYIRDHLQMIEDLLYSDTQADENGNYYSTYMDLASAAKYWLVQTVSSNSDGYLTGSTYLYKERDTDTKIGKLYWGPLWDFDMAWGGYDTEMLETAEGFNTINGKWLLPMFHDTDEKSFYQQILNEWPSFKSLMLDIVKDGGMLDQYYNETKASKAQDLETIPPYDPQKDYEIEIENTKKWIEHRVNWIDEHLSDLQDVSRKVKVLEEGQPDKIYYVRNNTNLSPLGSRTKEGSIFLGWETQDGTLLTNDSAVTSDLIVSPKFVSIEDATKYEEIIFQQDVVNILFEGGIPYIPNFAGFPEDAQYTNIQWESSDPDVAMVLNNAYVIPMKTGTVTITAVLDNGSRWSFIINFLENPIVPEDVTVTENMIINVGEHRRIDVDVIPESASLSSISYTLDETDIVVLNSSVGIVTGQKPGTIEVEVVARYINRSTFDEVVFKKICIVTVVENTEELEEHHPMIVDQVSYAQPQAHGIPTAVNTNTGFWLKTMTISLLGTALAFIQKRSKK